MTWLPGTMANGSGRIIMSDNICKYIGHIYIYLQYNTIHYITIIHFIHLQLHLHVHLHLHHITWHYITLHLHYTHTRANTHTHTYIQLHTYIHTYIYLYIYIYLFIYLYTSRLCDWISPHIMPRKGLTWTDSRLCNNLWLLVTEWHLANSALEW